MIIHFSQSRKINDLGYREDDYTLTRRHLSEGERAWIVSGLPERKPGGDGDRPKIKTNAPDGGVVLILNDPPPLKELAKKMNVSPYGATTTAPPPLKELAKKMNVSPRTVQRARSVKKQGVPELGELVGEGRVQLQRRGRTSLHDRRQAVVVGQRGVQGVGLQQPGKSRKRPRQRA